jgi:uncharacterized protein involved in exopolysaccharide biosynthesis
VVPYAYRQTFRAHRRLLIAPIVIAALVGGWFTFGAAPAYQSSASLWVDNESKIATAPAGSADATGPVGPAGLEAQVLDELLQTPSFDVAVGRGSQLPRFLAAGGTAGGFSPTVLLAHGGTADPEATAAESVNTNVGITVAGPQVLHLSFTGPTPAVARSVLASLISHLLSSNLSPGQTFNKTATAFYQRKLSAAMWAVENNRASLADYARDHAKATSINDPTYAALATEVRLADTDLAALQSAAAGNNSGGATIEVIDHPSLPDGPESGFSAHLAGVVGGAFAGLVLSLLALIFLTPRPSVPWDSDAPLFGRSGRLRQERGV